MRVAPNGREPRMVNVERLIIALYDEFDDITVNEACRELADRGWAHQPIEIDTEVWTPEDMLSSREFGGALAKQIGPVRWTGGPPDEDQIYTGSFLTVLLDFLLLDDALNRQCLQPSNG